MLYDENSRLVRFLRWTEKYTRTDMVYLVSGGFWLSIAQIGTSILGFLLTMVLANLLAPELLGEYRFLKGYRGNIQMGPGWKSVQK